MPRIDPKVRKIASEYIKHNKRGRAVLALERMLEAGSVTTDELKDLGYNHPPRAIGDVRDNGIPVITKMVKSLSGRRMASYRLGTADDIRKGQTGRTNFSKKFRHKLFDMYGSIDCITGAEHERRSLQIDHRIPYRIAGDEGLETDDATAYMLLDAKSQRLKSWSCENCENLIEKQEPAICRKCFWAFPENYSHIAMKEIRRVDIVWQGKEVRDYEMIVKRANDEKMSLQDFLKELGRKHL